MKEYYVLDFREEWSSPKFIPIATTDFSEFLKQVKVFAQTIMDKPTADHFAKSLICLSQGIRRIEVAFGDRSVVFRSREVV